MLTQLAGLEDGYYGVESKPHRKIMPMGFVLFQMSGDLEELEQALNRTPSDRRAMFGRESCSALIVPLQKSEDILFSHVTWSVYQTMLRIQKLYKFEYSFNGTAGQTVPSTVISMSSYPGTLLSIDDFYLCESGLAVTETTIGNSNSSLWKNIKPENSILSWIRVMVANRLASVGKEWALIFAQFNSGTYNNQFMILDYKKFKPGRPLPKSGLFTVVEQAPGLCVTQDLTIIITKQGYWPSYNVPYFPEIYNLTGNLDLLKKHGDWFSYHKTPRALIFKRDWSKVVDMESLKKLMRYNDFKNDPLSRCNCTPPYSAENAISARNDLNVRNGTYPFKQLGHRPHGATDMKATNYAMFKKLQFFAISGPTFDDQPPFKWSSTDFGVDLPHEGHPDLFAFEPVVNKWQYF
uniref:Phospholipase B-like n=1 Tax=Romanomermis culicivorax TaxID=13658 RepID=A0A915J1Y7_ROMCU